MRGKSFMVCLLIGYCFLPTLAASAQEVVHALCGTVRSINPMNKTITVGMNNGTVMLFNESTKSNVSLDFDKGIRSEATTLDSFTKSGVRIILYYFGNGDTRTAVALEDLGTGPFEETSGTVVKFDRHERVLTLRSNSGVEESFHLDPKTVAETPYGAMEGSELEAKDGDHLQVMASSVNGKETALFIQTM
jgi:hypothetical protein